MKTRMARMVAVARFSAVAFAGSANAHHSIGMFDISTPVWVKGTVLRYEPISPHAMIELEERRADGQVQRWKIEGPFPGRLQRILSLNRLSADEHLLNTGAVIEVCGFDLKENLRAQRPSPGTVAPSPKFMHGHVIVMPDGHMQSWGPYGKLDNCVRPNDRATAWRDFLNTDPLALDLWCSGRSYSGVASIAPKALVDEISSLITNRCQ